MFKRVLKILGICLAIFVGVLCAGFGIYALQGGFKNVEINILYLYMDDITKADKTIYTLEDFTTAINFEPLDATEKELEVIIQDPMRIEENGNLIQEGILKNVPTTVQAGEDFKIEINKDARGNNYGGAVTLTFKPKGNDKTITDFTLKIVVDVAIPNKSLYFAGNNGDSYSTVYGKTITMGISNNEQFVYLKSNLVNAFCLEADNQNLKSAEIGYTYITLDGKKCYDASTDKFVEKSSGIWTSSDAIINTFENLDYDRIYNTEEKQYNYYFKIPVTPKESGTITMTARMHKTYEIEQEYIANDFDNFVEPSANNPDAQIKVDKYNEFINKYIAYFDTTDESYEFFSNPNFMKSDGTITLPYRAIEQSKKFIFQTTTATINISAVNLKSITSTDVPQEFKVFDTETYTIQGMIDKFDLSIDLSEDNVAQVSTEKANLFSTLQVSPYIYLEKDEYIHSRETLWQNYGIVLGVVDFTSSGKPVVSDETISIENLESDQWIGFLVALSGKNAYKEYITSDLKNDAENKIWTLGFNTPLVRNNTETTIKTATRALFLQFQVSGRNLDTNEKIVKNDYTRIFINYTEYDYIYQDNAKISFDNSLKRMSITKSVSKASDYDYASELNEQSIAISLANSITNYDKVQYKNIMYFVEKNSNAIDTGGKKLASIGHYNFRYFKDGVDGAINMVKLFDGTENLVGERLPEDTLYALNASDEPARIFAIVYLSDKDGNPIDVNGRPIKINENSDEDTTLVVFAITDITQNGMASVVIDNFVSNINYYTISQVDYTISENVDSDNDGEADTTISYEISADKWVKRNLINSYVDSGTGLSFSEEKLEELKDLLRLKILYNNKITLYATNFDLTADGTISEKDTRNATYTMNIKDFYGKTIQKAFDINTLHNKQLALNRMVNNFNSNYYLYINATNTPAVTATDVFRSEDGSILGIQFDIVAEGKKSDDQNNYDLIYIKANNNVVNALSEANDYVSWTVNKLDVEDIELFDIQSETTKTALNTYNKLYAKYSEDSNKSQVFGNVKYGTNGFEFSSYYLYEYFKNDGYGFVKDSIDDNVYFVVKTNLYKDNEVNMSLVDMSQANYNNNSGNSSSNSNEFACIYDYIEYYTQNTNNIKVCYKNATGVAQLKDDLYFPSDGNYICVGSKKFEKQTGTITIDGTEYSRYITAGGRNYGVITSDNSGYYYGEEVVKISAGEYFPYIKSDTIYKVIICDEEFVIEDNKYETAQNTGIIYNISEATARQKTFKISTSTTINGTTYDVTNFIDDGRKDSTDTALEKTENAVDNTKYITQATIKFLRGGVLKDSANNDIYVKDENGKYYYNETSKQYEICPSNFTGERYSKKGIMAYLMISYNFNALDGKTITKVIAYELVQEPITLVATGNVDGKEETIELKAESQDTVTDELTINAGGDTEFTLGNVSSSTAKGNSNSINIVGASYEKSFFKHCTFTLDAGNSGITFIDSNGQGVEEITISSLNDKITLRVPDKYATTTAKIIISYIDENGENISRCLRLSVKPNYTFAMKESQTTGDLNYDSDTKKYTLSLNSGEHSISELISKYFNVSGGSIKLVNIDSDNKYASISGDTLTIGKSYAVDEDGQTTYDYVEFNMIIVDAKNIKNININETLYVKINPTYIIDMSNLTGDVLYGTDIISPDYITIYKSSVTTENKVSASEFETIANEIGLKLYKEISKNNYLDLDGKVISDDMYTTQSNVAFVIKYQEGLSQEISKNISLNVIGYEKYYSASGSFKDGDDYDTIKEKGKTDIPDNVINFVLKADEKLKLENYIRTYTIGNNNGVNIYPVLVLAETKENITTYSVASGSTIENNFGTYYLGFALHNSGEYTLLAVDNNVEISIQKLELFYSETGFDNSISYNTLTSNSSYTLGGNFTITTAETSVDINKYLKFYIDQSEIEVVIRDGDNEVSSTITSPASGESKTYNICYKLNGITIDSGYDVTITTSN